jgi:hypothetical protein
MRLTCVMQYPTYHGRLGDFPSALKMSCFPCDLRYFHVSLILFLAILIYWMSLRFLTVITTFCSCREAYGNSRDNTISDTE